VIRRLAALLAAGLALSACGSLSAPAALSAWVNQSNFHVSATALRSDAHHSATALRDLASTSNVLHTVCGVLLVDTQSANASLPTPDDQSTTLLSSAYTDFGAGANECYRASSSAEKRATALATLERAVAFLSEATARINTAAAGS